MRPALGGPRPEDERIHPHVLDDFFLVRRPPFRAGSFICSQI